jgi:hypothetical protein
MKYAFVRLFPALDKASPQSEISTANADVFGRPNRVSPSDDAATPRGDLQTTETPSAG